MHVTRRKPVKYESSFQILHRDLLAFPITGRMSIKMSAHFLKGSRVWGHHLNPGCYLTMLIESGQRRVAT